MKSSRFAAYLSLILTNIFWGLTFVSYKFAYEGDAINPSSLVFFRLLFSLFFLFGFAFIFKRLKAIRKRDMKWFLIMALFEPFFYFLGESNGMTLVTPTVGAIIISTIPLLVLLGSWYFFRERLTPLNIIGMAISFAGVLMVVLNKGEEGSTSLKGILLMFLAVLSATGYTLVARRLLRDYNPITITAYQSLLGLIMYLPLFFITGIPDLELADITTTNWLAVSFLGVFGSGICFVLLTYGIREFGAAKANIFANMIPVVTAIVSAIWLKEVLPAVKILGIAVTIMGLFMSQVGGLRLLKNGRSR